ncbi:MAG: AraC family transcriptional regulator [Oscillospiraceae bacterium]|nr:AraC family transcriptional regulator [Oscillospiraceae bacterium]
MNQIIYVGKHLLTFSVTRHAHSNWEFIYCTGGEGALVFDDFTLPYREGDIALIPPYVPHSNQSSDGFTNIHINMADPTLFFKSPLIIRDDSNRFIFNAFSGAFYQYSSAPGQQTPLLAAYGNLIACHLSAHDSEPKLSAVTREIRSSIINNYPDCNYELDVYLRSFPFSYDYLRKLFKKEIGVTPHRFLTDMRLQAAAESLGSDYADAGSISEVARMCGFREPLYFSRIFKNKYGVSPSVYQRDRSGAAKPADGSSMKILLP